MLKLGRYVYVHFLTVALILVCAANGRLFEITAAYIVMMMHELAHLTAALAIGLRISHIAIYPFGVNLRLKNKMIYSTADEIILYAAGPLCNAVFALISTALYAHSGRYCFQYMYILNVALFFVNLLPAVPLDGGIIMKKILTNFFGFKTARRVMTAISVCLAAALLTAGGYIIYVTRCNYSVMLLSALVIGNVFTQKEKYNPDYMKELMFYKNKKKKKVSVVVADKEISDFALSKRLDFGRYNVVFKVDKKGKIADIITELEIMNNLLG